jgi:hypothetical protein
VTGHPIYGGPLPALAYIGDEVADVDAPGQPLGTVEAVYREAVELSTGDQMPVAGLTLIHRAGPGWPR